MATGRAPSRRGRQDAAGTGGCGTASTRWLRRQVAIQCQRSGLPGAATVRSLPHQSAVLFPAGSRVAVSGVRHRHHAKAMATGRLHDPPAAVYQCDTPGAEPFEPTCLGFDIAGFDVQMHAGAVLHRLYLDVRPPGIGIEQRI